MPAFSQIQDNAERTNRILTQVTTAIMVLGLPALAFVLFCGRSLLTLSYGHRYGALSASLLLASGVALVNLLNGQVTTVFYARGYPQLHRLAVGAMAAAMVIMVYPLAKWLGPLGGQVACLLAVIVGYVIQLARVRHITGLSLARYGSGFLLAALAFLTVAAMGLGARPFAVLTRPVANIVIGVLGCLVAYTLAGVLFLRNQRDGAPAVLRIEP
jgi:O-antigen/teichoic acid export membrane protein